MNWGLAKILLILHPICEARILMTSFNSYEVIHFTNYKYNEKNHAMGVGRHPDK